MGAEGRARRNRGLVIAAAIGLVAGACGRKAERLATRPEALAACVDGCVKKVKEVAGPTPSPEQRRECDRTCGCIVDGAFLPNGERRPDAPSLSEITTACIGEKAPAPSAGSGPPIPPIRGERDLPPRSKLVFGRTLIAGTGCGKASRLPRFGFDEGHDRAWLVGEDEARFSWHLPTTWNARLERRDLLKIWGPPSRGGVFSVIELFVAPRCDGYDNQPVYERLATRALIGLNKQDETVPQVRQRDWQGRVGGPDFATEIALAVAIETPEGTRNLSLYVTKVGESKDFAVYAAGACPIDEPWGSIPVFCKSEYQSLARLK